MRSQMIDQIRIETQAVRDESTRMISAERAAKQGEIDQLRDDAEAKEKEAGAKAQELIQTHQSKIAYLQHQAREYMEKTSSKDERQQARVAELEAALQSEKERFDR